MRNSVLALALSLAVAAAPAFAGAPGANTFQFLQLDANARPVAMGGAYTALADDANALRYNPAGLGLVERHEATFMHNQYFQDVSQEYLAYASPLGIGAAVNMLKFGDVPRTTNSNPSGAGLGSTSLSAMAMSAGYGRKLGAGLSVGGAGKVVRQTIGGVAGQGYAVDFGALYEPPPFKQVRIGFAIQNLGPSVKYQGANEHLPTTARLGASHNFSYGVFANTLSFDLLNELRNGANVAVGIESVINGRGALRFGFDNRNDAGPGFTVGIGLLVGRGSLDYAFVPFGELGTAHRLSVSIRWGEKIHVPEAAALGTDTSRGSGTNP